MLELLRHSTPKAFFRNTIVSLGIFSRRIQNSKQTCCWVFNSFFFLQLEQHFVLHTLFLYQCVKTKIVIVRRSFWHWTMQKTFLFLRMSLYVYHSHTLLLSSSPYEDTWVGNYTITIWVVSRILFNVESLSHFFQLVLNHSTRIHYCDSRTSAVQKEKVSRKCKELVIRVSRICLYRVTKKCFRQKFWNSIKKLFSIEEFLES